MRNKKATQKSSQYYSVKPFEGTAKHYGELKSFADYLYTHTATATQAAVALGIYRPNACRYKRLLQKLGRLFELAEVTCPITGYPAHLITTDPARVPANPQLSLF